jgi:hypothetical protein
MNTYEINRQKGVNCGQEGKIYNPSLNVLDC